MALEHSQSSGRDLQILTICPLCHATYNPQKTQIMAEVDDSHLVYLECRQCSSAVVAVVTTGHSGLSSVGAVTDLTSQEILDDRFTQTVTVDDVVSVFDWLEHDPAHVQHVTSGLTLA